MPRFVDKEGWRDETAKRGEKTEEVRIEKQMPRHALTEGFVDILGWRCQSCFFRFSVGRG